MKPQRIQLSRKKGFNLQRVSQQLNGLPAVNCARPHRWGNPFKVDDYTSVQQVIEQFNQMVREGKTPPFSLANIREELRGKNLACWCKIGEPCHCDILLSISNSSE